MLKNPKRDIQAPCRFTYVDGERVMDSYPDVTCGLDCKDCCWNPKERKRRMKQGHFEKRTKTLELHDDSGKEVVATITDDVWTLVYPRRDVNA